MSEVHNHGFSDEWTPAENRPGYMVKKVEVGYITCYAYKPILSPDEQSRREKEVMNSIARVMAPYLVRKGRNESA